MAVDEIVLARCRQLGILNAGVARMGLLHHPFGSASIVQLEGGRYAPAPTGQRRLILPVHEDGELVDLVAVSSTEPDDWHVRTGAATALGLFDGWHHRWVDAVPVHRNPLEWLRAGGEGLCILDWSSPDLDRLRDLPAMSVNDAGLARNLTASLTKPLPIPDIYINTNGAQAREAA